jgi:hypothetical protein
MELSPEQVEAIFQGTSGSWVDQSGKPVPVKVDHGIPDLSVRDKLVPQLLSPGTIVVQPLSWWEQPSLFGWPRWVVWGGGLVGGLLWWSKGRKR